MLLTDFILGQIWPVFVVYELFGLAEFCIVTETFSVLVMTPVGVFVEVGQIFCEVVEVELFIIIIVFEDACWEGKRGLIANF